MIVRNLVSSLFFSYFVSGTRKIFLHKLNETIKEINQENKPRTWELKVGVSRLYLVLIALAGSVMAVLTVVLNNYSSK